MSHLTGEKTETLKFRSKSSRTTAEAELVSDTFSLGSPTWTPSWTSCLVHSSPSDLTIAEVIPLLRQS